jgi:hypothetical protein
MRDVFVRNQVRGKRAYAGLDVAVEHPTLEGNCCPPRWQWVPRHGAQHPRVNGHLRFQLLFLFCVCHSDSGSRHSAAGVHGCISLVDAALHGQLVHASLPVSAYDALLIGPAR